MDVIWVDEAGHINTSWSSANKSYPVFYLFPAGYNVRDGFDVNANVQLSNIIKDIYGGKALEKVVDPKTGRIFFICADGPCKGMSPEQMVAIFSKEMQKRGEAENAKRIKEQSKGSDDSAKAEVAAPADTKVTTEATDDGKTTNPDTTTEEGKEDGTTTYNTDVTDSRDDNQQDNDNQQGDDNQQDDDSQQDEYSQVKIFESYDDTIVFDEADSILECESNVELNDDCEWFTRDEYESYNVAQIEAIDGKTMIKALQPGEGYVGVKYKADGSILVEKKIEVSGINIEKENANTVNVGHEAKFTAYCYGDAKDKELNWTIENYVTVGDDIRPDIYCKDNNMYLTAKMSGEILLAVSAGEYSTRYRVIAIDN